MVASLTLTSMWGKGPREFSGTLMGGMTQSLFCRLSPLEEEPLWCFLENLITLGWESHTLDSISSKVIWKEKGETYFTRPPRAWNNFACCVLLSAVYYFTLQTGWCKWAQEFFLCLKLGNDAATVLMKRSSTETNTVSYFCIWRIMFSIFNPNFFFVSENQSYIYLLSVFF